MPRGTSGRVVIEIDPYTKDMLYQALEREGCSLKRWFLSRVEAYLSDGEQLDFAFENNVVEPRNSA